MSKEDSSTIKRFFSSRLFLLIAIPLVVLLVFSYLRSVYSGYKINQEIAALDDQIRKLEGKKLESMKILDYVMSDAFVEAKARTELNMKKPGEKVLVFTNGDVFDTGEEAWAGDEKGIGQRLSNPVKWWNYFVKN